MLLKILFILALLIIVSGVLLSAVFMRLRPYVKSIRKFLKSFREIGEMDSIDGKDIIKPTRNLNEKLARCSSCGIWIPQNRAVKLKSNIFYCSHACLEQAAEPVKQKRRSGI